MRRELMKTIRTAAAAAKKYDDAKNEMGGKLSELLSEVMPHGFIIDFSKESLIKYPWLRMARTTHGNDHGAKAFMVEGRITVTPEPRGVGNSKWSCEAHPLNAQGKALSGKVHGENRHNKSTVKLSGHLFPLTLFDDADDQKLLSQLIKLAEKNRNKKPVEQE